MVKRCFYSFAAAAMIVVLTPDVRSQDDVRTKLEFELQKHRVEQIFSSKLTLPGVNLPRAIYGADNRQDVVKLPAGKIKNVAAATCLLTNKNRVAKVGNQYQLALGDYRYGGVECCGGERFADQKVGGWCSGFLVGKDIVVTAGHCCENSDASVQGIAFVFGFAVDASGSTPSNFSEDRIYFGKKIVKHQLDGLGDFAIIQLDGPVTAPGAAPLAVVSDSSMLVNEDVVLVGYPAGLPCKSADGAKIIQHMAGGAWSWTNCDSYGGNSGSCVVDLDGRVVGILVRGKADFMIKSSSTGPCFESVRYHDADAGEIITRPEVFRASIPVSP